jgi:hypothetical protein
VPRPHIEFIHSLDLPVSRPASGWFAGAQVRVLSEDDTDGSQSLLVRVPGFWKGDWAGLDRPVEVFILRGRMVVGGQELVEGRYAWVPSGASDRAISTTEDTLFIAFVEPARPVSGEVEVTDSNEMPWEPIGVAQGTASGIHRKLLRRDPVTGDDTYMVAAVAYWMDDKAERHPTIQEGFIIRGDCLDGRAGGMVPGDYFWRPAMGPHGPMFTHSGNLFLFRTKGGSWDVTYEDVPEWRTLVQRYKSQQPFFPVTDW